MLIKKSNIAVILILSILSIVYLNCGGGESTTDSVKAGAGADRSVTERQGSGTGENETAALMTVVDGVKQWDGRPKNIAGGMLIAYRDEYRATVEMETVGGDLADGKSFKFDMWYSDAPTFRLDAVNFTVNNFVFLARQGFYDGLTFHKVIAGEMALTGDPPGPLTGAGYTFDNEVNNKMKHTGEGIISFYNEGLDENNRGTNSSQWFIAYKAFPEYNYYDEEFYKRDCASPDIKCYTPFGMIFEGLDIAKSITEGDIIKTVTIEKLERGTSNLPPGNR
jgi:peptidyl-prolyl cis-trans isomerase B (cyclophilin B)